MTLLDIRLRLDAALPHVMEEYLLDDGDVPIEDDEPTALKL